MFSYVSRLLYEFQSKPVQKILLLALGLLVLGIFLASVVRWLRRRRQDRPESWTGLVVAALGNLLKVFIGLAVAAGICMHLRFSSEEFARLRGGVSDRNFEAVKTIWGRPHCQRELDARLTYETTHFYDKDGLEIDPDKLRATSQPISYRKEEIEHTIPGNAIIKADHDLRVAMNYRQKGGAWYPGFEADCAFKYRIRNFSDRDVNAVFFFPMPEGQGLIDNFTLEMDGRPYGGNPVIDAEAARWGMPMKPGDEFDLAVRYHSRGLRYIRFDPGAGRQLQDYRVHMLCQGVPAGKIDYPMGCMTPTKLTDMGEDTDLLWKLDGAVTRLGMGVILPDREQPGYYVARVLAAGPWGLALMLVVVAASALATGRTLHWLPLAVLAACYHLYYLLMAHLGDYWPLAGAMLLSAAALAAVLAVFHFAWSQRFTAWTALGAFIVFTVAYPLIRISGGAGLLETILYVVILGYVVALLVVEHTRRRRARPAEG